MDQNNQWTGIERYADVVTSSSDMKKLAHAIAIKVAEHAGKLDIDEDTYNHSGEISDLVNTGLSRVKQRYVYVEQRTSDTIEYVKKLLFGPQDTENEIIKTRAQVHATKVASHIIKKILDGTIKGNRTDDIDMIARYVNVAEKSDGTFFMKIENQANTEITKDTRVSSSKNNVGDIPTFTDETKEISYTSITNDAIPDVNKLIPVTVDITELQQRFNMLHENGKQKLYCFKGEIDIFISCLKGDMSRNYFSPVPPIRRFLDTISNLLEYDNPKYDHLKSTTNN